MPTYVNGWWRMNGHEAQQSSFLKDCLWDIQDGLFKQRHIEPPMDTLPQWAFNEFATGFPLPSRKVKAFCDTPYGKLLPTAIRKKMLSDIQHKGKWEERIAVVNNVIKTKLIGGGYWRIHKNEVVFKHIGTYEHSIGVEEVGEFWCFNGMPRDTYYDIMYNKRW